MQQIKLYQLLLSALLLLSIFSFSTSTFMQESSELYYETLLEDNNEGDDKEQESEEKLFVLSGFFTYTETISTKSMPFFQAALPKFRQFSSPFRPPIFS